MGALGALALAAAAPSAAHAGPLLSGYGGPGQGNQAILGSSLLGGPGGGGSTGAGGASTSSGLAAAPSAAPGAARSGAGSTAGAGGASHAGANGSTRAHGAPPPEVIFRPYPAREVAAGTAGGLGLSGAEVSYIVIAAAILVLTGALTRAIAGARTAKGQ